MHAVLYVFIVCVYYLDVLSALARIDLCRCPKYKNRLRAGTYNQTNKNVLPPLIKIELNNLHTIVIKTYISTIHDPQPQNTLHISFLRRGDRVILQIFILNVCSGNNWHTINCNDINLNFPSSV